MAIIPAARKVSLKEFKDEEGRFRPDPKGYVHKEGAIKYVRTKG